MTTRANYAELKQAKVERTFDGLYEESKSATAFGNVLDSTGKVTDGLSHNFLQNNTGALPECLQKILDQTNGEHGALIVDSVLQGMKLHEKAHGYLPTADVIESALDSVMISLAPLKDLKIDGVGSTAHHDALSAMPEKIQIGLLSSIAEAFPAATYLPTGIGSNQAILGIVNHQAGSEVGGYKIGQLLDGINTGDTYLSSGAESCGGQNAPQEQYRHRQAAPRQVDARTRQDGYLSHGERVRPGHRKRPQGGCRHGPGRALAGARPHCRRDGCRK